MPSRKTQILTIVIIITFIILAASISSEFINESSNEDGKSNDVDDQIYRTSFVERDPSNFSTPVTQSEALEKIENLGYEPKDENSTLIESFSENKVYWEIYWEEKTDPVRVSVDANNGEILLITDLSEEGPLDVEENISKENIETYALKIRKEISSFSTTILSESVIESEQTHDVVMEYRCSWKQKVDGYIVEPSYIQVTFGADGHLMSYTNMMYDELSEKEFDKKISESEVLRIADEEIENRRILEKLSEYSRDIVENNTEIITELSIRRSYYLLNESRNLYGDELRLAWMLKYINEDGLQGHVMIYIDAETGEYLGIDQTM